MTVRALTFCVTSFVLFCCVYLIDGSFFPFLLEICYTFYFSRGQKMHVKYLSLSSHCATTQM